MEFRYWPAGANSDRVLVSAPISNPAQGLTRHTDNFPATKSLFRNQSVFDATLGIVVQCWTICAARNTLIVADHARRSAVLLHGFKRAISSAAHHTREIACRTSSWSSFIAIVASSLMLNFHGSYIVFAVVRLPITSLLPLKTRVNDVPSGTRRHLKEI